MEVRTIKTCHGWEQVQFLDGALLPEGIDPSEENLYRRLHEVEVMDLKFWVRLPLTGYRVPIQIQSGFTPQRPIG